MILVIDVCGQRLHYEEFVRPVAESIPPGRQHYIKHFQDVSGPDIEGAESIIICGTALKDCGFMEHLEMFSWLKATGKPVLGICAGMQIMAAVFGAKTETKTEIGMTEIAVKKKGTLLGNANFKAYELHNFAPLLPAGFVPLAESATCLQAFAHKERPLFGVLFHPEVRNKTIIERFIGSV